MTSSIDWTTPEAYGGRFVAAPPRRQLIAALLLRARIAIRARQRARREAERMFVLRMAGRHLSERMRQDLGLPPWG